MFEMRNGSFKLFQLFGITVWLHWSWFAVAAFFILLPGSMFSGNLVVGVATYLGLFAIVLTHEFGHALACRSVGGRAETIMLWPLGGIAFVEPPQRPGAVLWSIAAGPLVNVVLLPILMFAWIGSSAFAESSAAGAAIAQILGWLNRINFVLLVFNMLPIYPLDGGQILQALLWFFLGRAKSLKIASGIGLVVAVVGGALCLLSGEMWLFVLALFIGWQAYNGWRVAHILAMHEQMQNPWDRN